MKKVLSLTLTLILALNCCMIPSFATEDRYSDTHGHWAESSIERWSEYEIVSGNRGKFNPDSNMTRGQLAKVLANTLGLTEETKANPFSDVSILDWYYPYVMRCYAAGIMLGDNGKANPNASITREQAIVMMCRAMNVEPDYSGAVNGFIDSDTIASYAVPYINAMVKAGVIGGDKAGNVLPKGALTRGAFMAILDRSVVQYINEPGTYNLTDKDGIILVASGNVTLTGKTSADVVITEGASGGTVNFDKATITGSMTIQADNATITSKNSTLPKAEILGEGSKVSNNTTTTGGSSSGGSSGGSSSGGSSSGSSGGGSSTPTIPDLVVTEPGSTYSNATYRNVTIAASVGDGDVTLDNVTITGDIVVNGCGSNTFGLKNCTISLNSTIKVNKDIHLFEGATEVPRIELINTPVPKIETLSPTILESTDTNSIISTVVARENLEVRGSSTQINSITIPSNIVTPVTITATAGNISDIVANSQISLTGTSGNVEKVTTSANVAVNSDIVGKVVVADTATESVSVDISGDSAVEVVANTDKGVEINSGSATVTVSTDLATAPDNVKVDNVEVHIHKWDAGVVTTEPTCTGVGIKTYTCTADGCTTPAATKTEDIPVIGHIWDEGSVTTPATCTSTGVKTYTCTREDCDGTKTEDIPALGHTSEVVPAVPATCTEKGLTAGSKCSVCDTILVAQELTDPLGHSWGNAITGMATCTTDGKITKSCTRCDAIDEEVIPATGHDYSGEPIEHGATCTTDGYNQYICNNGCGIDKKEPIPALGHDYGETYLSDSTSHWQKCSRCKQSTEKVDHVFGDTVACDSPDKCSICGYETEAVGHRWDEGTVTTPATCTSTGVMTFKCTACDEEKTEVITALGHDYSTEFTVDQEATCTTDGSKSKHCSRCNSVTEETTIDALGHAWDEGTVTTAATCTTDGVKKYTCTRDGCDGTNTEVIPALGHDYSTEFTIDKEATCTEAGSKSKHCSRCDSVTDVTTIPALGHDLVYIDSDNMHTVSCERCDADLGTESHEWNDGVVVKEPTCTNTGSKSYLCIFCNGNMIDEIPAKGHTEETVKGTPATCEEAGLTDGTKCSVCGTWINEQETIEALGHDWEHIEGYLATCTEEGLEDYERCSRCGAQDGFTVIPATGHEAAIDEAVAPTCTTTGLTEGSHCSVCDEVIVEQEVVPATGHTPVVDEAVAATCETQGLTEGSHCSVCGETIVEQEVIPETGHILVRKPGYAPSCTIAGLTDGWECSSCGYVDTEQQDIPPNGHNLKKVDAKDPTCTEDGNIEHYKCSVCNAVFSDANGTNETTIEAVTIPATGHTEVIDEAGVPATCTTTGKRAKSHCSVCDAILSDGSELGVKDHTYIYTNIYDENQHSWSCNNCTATGFSAHGNFIPIDEAHVQCEDCGYTRGIANEDFYE